MNNPSSFLYQLTGEGVATITLNRPERLNALTFEVYRELTNLFAELRDESAVRVVVITGSGRAFCSGGDVHDIIGELFKRDMEGLLAFTRMTCELVANIRDLHKPVIASLNGTTAGAGACIALASDIRIAAEEAKIAFLFVKVGLSGADMGAAYLLPRVVGLAKATELLYTGDFISAAEVTTPFSTAKSGVAGLTTACTGFPASSPGVNVSVTVLSSTTIEEMAAPYSHTMSSISQPFG